MGEEKGKSGLRYVIQRMTLLLLFAVILFVESGTLRWLRGCVYIVYVFLLRRELEGYDSYTQKIRYRLIPGIWQKRHHI